jgi:hypothetical protein
VDGEKFDIEVMEALGERVGVERIPSPPGLDMDKLPLSSRGGGLARTFGLGTVDEVGVPDALYGLFSFCTCGVEYGA